MINRLLHTLFLSVLLLLIISKSSAQEISQSIEIIDRGSDTIILQVEIELKAINSILYVPFAHNTFGEIEGHLVANNLWLESKALISRSPIEYTFNNLYHRYEDGALRIYGEQVDDSLKVYKLMPGECLKLRLSIDMVGYKNQIKGRLSFFYSNSYSKSLQFLDGTISPDTRVTVYLKKLRRSYKVKVLGRFDGN